MCVMKQEIEKSVDIDESFSDDIRALRLQREKELRDNSEAIALFEISCIYGSPLPVKVVGIFCFYGSEYSLPSAVPDFTMQR